MIVYPMGNWCCKERQEQNEQPQRQRARGQREPAQIQAQTQTQTQMQAQMVLFGTNKKLIKISKYAKDEQDLGNVMERLQKREAFWETSPSYSGRVEVWQMLRMACEAESIETAQAILDSESLTCPTGKLTDGCYDTLGNLYRIPVHCLGALEMKESDFIAEKTMASMGGSKANSVADLHEKDGITIRFRFSSGHPDMSLIVPPVLKVSKLRKKLAEALSLNSCDPSADKLDYDDGQLKIVFLGKVLDSVKRLSDYKIPENTFVQVFIKA